MTGNLQKLLQYIKFGSKTNRGNYLPVSLTCVCCKLLESLVRDYMEYLDNIVDNRLLHKTIWLYQG